MAEATVIHLPELPESITREQALAAMEILGLPSSVSTYELDCKDGITVGLLAEDIEGRKLRVGDGPAIITVQIPFAQEHTHPPLTPEERERIESEWKAKVSSEGPNHGPVVL